MTVIALPIVKNLIRKKAFREDHMRKYLSFKVKKYSTLFKAYTPWRRGATDGKTLLLSPLLLSATRQPPPAAVPPSATSRRAPAAFPVQLWISSPPSCPKGRGQSTAAIPNLLPFPIWLSVAAALEKSHHVNLNFNFFNFILVPLLSGMGQLVALFSFPTIIYEFLL